MQALRDLVPSYKIALGKFFGSNKEVTKSSECGGLTHSKLKYSKQELMVKTLSEDYDLGTIDEKILFEISMGLD
jgi:hypothetical protein